ncbi:hypothetical protein N431DRAFT_179585 [Stipitochalara longipes BDJ]|nr:hypothetical protein N431DRAFT_179585 [Stipitochalara longipes BDJ]
MKKRVRLMLELYKQVRHRYGFTGLDILMTGRICRMPLPIIKCELCPEWEHKILGGDDVPSVLAVGKAHLQSVEHPVKYDEEEVKEYMRRHSPAQLLSTNGKLLERLRKRHQGSNLELDIGKESGALIHCRDCHVYIHIQSSRRDDSSRTIRKVDDHFATTRHKRLARTRIENAKRRKRYEKLYFDETLTKRRRQIAPQRSKSSPGLNSQKVVELDDVILPMQRPTHH